VARILTDTFTCPADSTPTYSDWAAVGSATSLNATAKSVNDESPDLWVQWTDDTEGPEPEDVDVFAGASDPETPQHYYVEANGLTPAGAYIRIKGIAYGVDCGPVHVTIDTA
jgi:hypothetical protein